MCKQGYRRAGKPKRDSSSTMLWAGAWDSTADSMALGGMEDAAAFGINFKLEFCITSVRHHIIFHVMVLYFSKILYFFLLIGFGGREGFLQFLRELWREG